MKNKKLIATIASLCLVVVAVVAAVVGVLAASSQTVKGTVSVEYRANDVSAIVSLASKQHGGSYGTPDSHEFLKTDGNESATTLTIAKVDLSSSVNWVCYKFTFQNTNSSYGMTVTPTYTKTETEGKTDANVDVYYSWTAEPTVAYTSEVASVTGGTALTASGNLGGAQTVAKSGIGTLYLMVAIHDLNADAHYYLGGTNENALSFALARA